MRTNLLLLVSMLAAAPGVEALSPAAVSPISSATASGSNPAAEGSDRLAWFREARFGMFIHWGLYSVAAGEWEGKTTAGASEWLMNDLQIPLSQYQKLAPQFNPTNFNAREWVRLAKDAGMKYLVITTKHHDGFAMFPSAQTDWCIKATPFRRNPLKELAAACAEQGIKLGFYHSIMDWHHPDYAPRKPWNDIATTAPDFDRYVLFLKAQLHELLTGYGPIALLWFDGQWENTWTYERGANLEDYVRGLQPRIILNNRVGTELPLAPGQHRLGDYSTPEQSIPPNGLGPGVDWETCMTMNNSWGFKASDTDWKSTQTLVRNVVDCASKGGNYLLNIGPRPDGTIPEASVRRLREIGAWMRTNGEAIYGTTAGPFEKALPWGRCTTRTSGGTTLLYLHVFDWPADGELLIPGLKNPPLATFLLADPQRNALPTEAAEDGLHISLPKTAPDPISSTVAVRLRGTPELQPITLLQKRDGSLTLPASEARLHGATFKYESGGLLDNIGYWTTPEDWVDWEFEISRPGKFTITAVIASPASGAFEVSIGGQTLRCTAPNSGNYFNFQSVCLGQVQLAAPGKAMLAVRPIKDGWQPMNLRAIRLTPQG